MRSGKQFTTAQAAVEDGTAVFDDVGGLVALQATIFEAEDGKVKEKEFKLAIQRVSPLTSSLLPLVAAHLPTRAVKSIVGRVASYACSSPGQFRWHMVQVAPNKEPKTIGNIHVNMVDFAQARCGRVV